jgi:hypothetical protein
MSCNPEDKNPECKKFGKQKFGTPKIRKIKNSENKKSGKISNIFIAKEKG